MRPCPDGSQPRVGTSMYRLSDVGRQKKSFHTMVREKAHELAVQWLARIY